MDAITLGLICGLVFGLIDIGVMLPMKFETPRKKKEAITSAFVDRFMLGFLIPNVSIDLHPAVIGAFLGLGLSVPSAIISRAFAPIIGIGVAGGVLIGFITHAVI
ncbi:MAG: hypothetical protein M1539_02745 [Actinobacteria bacterium]|nr:hypothetical protein [Actinomycetota bacterium]MCL5882884.1 hypothetical protein [Actinomycetota bacterium]